MAYIHPDDCLYEFTVEITETYTVQCPYPREMLKSDVIENMEKDHIGYCLDERSSPKNVRVNVIDLKEVLPTPEPEEK